MPKADPIYFADAAALRAWFAEHAAEATELIVGFMKVHSGQCGLSWSQAVDEALCVGWIDAVRRRVDAERYQIRFTRRQADSHWSAVNIAKVAALSAQGRMQPAGLAAFALRTEAKSRRASYEQDHTPDLAADEIAELRADAAAWAYYQTLPPSYLHKLHWWVVNAKQTDTRARRLRRLIAACAQGVRL